MTTLPLEFRYLGVDRYMVLGSFLIWYVRVFVTVHLYGRSRIYYSDPGTTST